MKSSTEKMARSAAADLKADLQGELIWRHDPGYDNMRAVWNGSIDKHPALIARCASESDVLSCVRFARDENIPVSADAKIPKTPCEKSPPVT